MKRKQLHQEVMEVLEAIMDPCSLASGAPAGLVSMGLVGDVSIKEADGGAEVDVVLFLTEPGCMMGAFFQITAKQKLEMLPAIKTANIAMDYGHVWGPEQMTKEYREKLNAYRACQSRHMHELRSTTTI